MDAVEHRKTTCCHCYAARGEQHSVTCPLHPDNQKDKCQNCGAGQGDVHAVWCPKLPANKRGVVSSVGRLVPRTDEAVFAEEVRKTFSRVASPVHRPDHYTRFKIEPIYFIMENGLSFEQGNVIKYVCRHDAKNGVEDLKKARRYLDMMIKKAEGDPKYAD